MSTTIHHAFSSTAASYDEHRSRLIPGFEGLYRWAVDLIPEDATRVLDLGAGTGLLSAFVRKRFPNAHLHLVDFSEAMLSKAKDRFAEDPHVSFAIADYSTTKMDGSYDAVISALSIHHLSDESKREIFSIIAGLLHSRGMFINAEQVLGPTPALEQRYKENWLAQVRVLGATEEQIRDSLFRQQADLCATVKDQLDWMHSAGFTDVDCWFKEGRFAVLAGMRP
ncbi:MAG: class I SAM-dependent methyltransferase [Janthinobacterium lividum]